MARRTPELLQYLGKQDHQKLFQVLTRLPRFGMGRKFTRAIWRMEDTSIKAHPSYWTITRVVPNKDMKRGKIWGVLTWRGKSEVNAKGEERVRRVRSPLKKQWKVLPKDS